MQQDLLPWLEPGQLEHIEPGRRVHLGNGCGFLQAQAFRYRQHVTRIDHHFLGHAATGEQCTNPITDLPGDASAHLADHPGALQAKKFAGSRRWWVEPGTLQQIGTIEAGGSHANSYLTDIAGWTCRRNPLHMSVNALQCLHSASIVES
ncbi:hypothetical protein D3C72_1446440 [compost metagenome]